MLYRLQNTFHFQVDNVGSTYTEAGLGTSLTAGGSNHTKNGTPTSIISALAENVYFISIGFINGFSSGASRRFLVDIYVDPSGGTSWESTPRIANLSVNTCSYAMGGTWYHFPLYIPAGASIGAACQAETASATCRIIISCQGKPSNPSEIIYGTKVITYGETTATTVGTAMTAGASGAMGAYSASLATTTESPWWWQTGMLINDISQTAVTYWMDAAYGDGSNKYFLQRGKIHNNIGTVESASYSTPGIMWPFVRVPVGASLFVRSACSGTSDSNISGILYGVI